MKNTVLFVYFLSIGFILFAQQKNLAHPNSPEWKQAVTDFEIKLHQTIAEDTTGSFSGAIVKDDQIIWSKAFGKMNNQSGQMADTNTVYRIGSISKTITAYLMMLLVQDGKFGLDEPVVKYLPEITTLNKSGRHEADLITFRQLASHSSGLDREPANWVTNASGPIADWENKVLQSIPLTRLNHAPGKEYFYSNIGYGILGLAVSRAAGKSFIELVEERVFRRHAMVNSFYVVTGDNEPRIAAGNHWNPSPRIYGTAAAQNELAGRGYKVPNGGVFTTANDLARFVIALTSDTDVLSKKHSDTMQTIQSFVNKKKNVGYGLGLTIDDDTKGKKIAGHDGQVAGFTAIMIFNPETRIGLVLLSNRDNASRVMQREGNILVNKLVNALK